MTDGQTTPRLAPPGAGVPWWQRLGGKHLLLPAYCRRMTWEGVPEMLDRQAARFVGLAGGRSEAELTRRVLVPRQIGLEDSSRHYSYAMVLEHLTIIGARVAEIVVELSHGRHPAGVVRTADLKPRGEWTAAETTRRFLTMNEQFRHRTLTEVGDRASATRHEHPWFGPLGVFQWHCFAPFHQEIHLRQAERILARLPAGGA